jgi:hypothetical protein
MEGEGEEGEEKERACGCVRTTLRGRITITLRGRKTIKNEESKKKNNNEGSHVMQRCTYTSVSTRLEVHIYRFRVWGLGFSVWGLGFGVWELGFRVTRL